MEESVPELAPWSAMIEENSVCQRCGLGFRCGVVAGQDSCWCFDLPRVSKAAPAPKNLEGKSCYCPNCLNELTGRNAKA